MNRSSASINSSNSSQYNQDNENLEEDMRKAKESADILRAVVLPLETEISSLKSKLDVAQKKIHDLDGIIRNTNMPFQNDPNMDEFKFYIDMNNDYEILKNDLNTNFNKFINAEIKNVNLINGIYAFLNDEQKDQLIANFMPTDLNVDEKEFSENSNRDRFIDWINTVTVPQSIIDEMLFKFEELFKSFMSLHRNEKTKSDLIEAYEAEKKCREEIEQTLADKGAESKKEIELLNKEMANLASIIDELRGQYVNWQSQFQLQIDGLVKLNEDIRTEMQEVERNNERLKADNLKLKSANKQLHGERSLVLKEFDGNFEMPQTIEDLQKLILIYKEDIVKLKLENKEITKNYVHAQETIKQLQSFQNTNQIQDQLVISQSLESELERERKVRKELENEHNLLKNALKDLKNKIERTEIIIRNLRKLNEQYSDEIEKFKNENQELNNHMQILRRDMKNNLSVQEDLVKLNQSLQIELEQTRAAEQELRCQHEDDYDECAKCKNMFTVTRRKHRCKHCCKIYCADCCDKIVHSGPNMRPHKVCDNCFMIFDKDSKKS